MSDKKQENQVREENESGAERAPQAPRPKFPKIKTRVTAGATKPWRKY